MLIEGNILMVITQLQFKEIVAARLAPSAVASHHYLTASTSRKPERVKKVLALPKGISRSISRLVTTA